jgi:hypothetical protein
MNVRLPPDATVTLLRRVPHRNAEPQATFIAAAGSANPARVDRQLIALRSRATASCASVRIRLMGMAGVVL